MPKIETYAVVTPATGDLLLGSDVSNTNATRNFTPLSLTNTYNVRWFGAVGDGVNDDTSAIQAAIDAAETAGDSAGGAVVWFPPGVYLVSSTLQVSNDGITLLGAGAAADTNAASATSGSGTLITPAAAFADGTYVLSVGTVGATRPVAGCRLQGIRIGKLATLSNTVHGILWKCYRSDMVDVFVDTMSGSGIVVRGRTGAEGGSWNTYEDTFRRVQVRGCGSAGIHLDSATADMHLTDCIFHGNVYGIYSTGTASTHFVSCHSYTNSTNNVLLSASGSRSKFIGCKFENSGQHNFNVDMTSGGLSTLHLLGCNFNSGGYSANNTYDNFIVQRSSGGSTASGVMSACSFQWISTPNNGGTSKPRYHVNLSSAVAINWRISGNLYDANAQTASFRHASTAVTCLHNNLGINVGNPTTTGQWLNLGQEGNMVVDTGTNTIYVYANGAWRAVN